jgi:hypothetical protein
MKALKNIAARTAIVLVCPTNLQLFNGISVLFEAADLFTFPVNTGLSNCKRQKKQLLKMSKCLVAVKSMENTEVMGTMNSQSTETGKKYGCRIGLMV